MEQGFAQAWQDWFLWRNFFAGQTSDLYLDIGTNQAVTISNTFFFDHCLVSLHHEIGVSPVISCACVY